MKIIIFLLSLFLFSLFFLRHEALLISQYYSKKRYLMTLFQEDKKRMTKSFYLFFFPLLFFLLFFLKIEYVTILFLCAWLIDYLFSPSFMPLKKTRRSLTLFFFSFILWGTIIYFSSYILRLIFASMLPFMASFCLLISSTLLQPYEKEIQKYYIKKAKRTMKNNPHLITIAITGSYGKSSFKYFLYQFLKMKYQVIMTPKSINTPMGITKFINENLDEHTEIMILEFGVDEKKGMDRLLSIVVPDIGVLTAIGKMHMKTFHSLENIYLEKRKLLFKAKKGYFSMDSSYLKAKEKDLTTMEGYSYQDIFSYVNRHENGLEVEYMKERMIIPLYGMFQLSNISGAIQVATDLGVSKKEIRQILPSLEGVEHRFKKRKEGHMTIFDDAYNGNEEGILEAIQTVMLQKGKKAIITPGVIELGKDYEKVNQNIGRHLIHFDRVYIVSKENKHPLYDGYMENNGEKDRIEFVSCFLEGYQRCKEEKINVLLIANDTFSTFLK